MNIIAVDDEQPALEQIMRVLNEVFDSGAYSSMKGFQDHKQAFAYLQELLYKGEQIDYAFLDIKLRGMRGIEFAKNIKELFPAAKILFVTGYSKYACEAFQLHALGYILKPATRESVEGVLDNFMEGWREKVVDDRKIRVQTFGNFDVYVRGKPLLFERTKAKELFAYLIDRKGAGATTAEVSAVLWEDKEYNKNLKNQTQKIISCMMKNLRDTGIEDVIVKRWNYLAVDTEKISCDYYDFLKEDLVAVNSYMGEYMANYSWAEFTTASLQNLFNKMKDDAT